MHGGLYLVAQGMYSDAQGLYIVHVGQMLHLAGYWLAGGPLGISKLELGGGKHGFGALLSTTTCRHDIAE